MSYPKKVYPRKSSKNNVIRSKFCYLIVKKGKVASDLDIDMESRFHVDEEEVKGEGKGDCELEDCFRRFKEMR